MLVEGKERVKRAGRGREAHKGDREYSTGV